MSCLPNNPHRKKIDDDNFKSTSSLEEWKIEVNEARGYDEGQLSVISDGYMKPEEMRESFWIAFQGTGISREIFDTLFNRATK